MLLWASCRDEKEASFSTIRRQTAACPGRNGSNRRGGALRSRAKGTYKPGSDIDLSLEGAALDWRVVGRMYDALDDLLLPYKFSLIVHDKALDPEVAAHIARVGIPLFERQQVG